MKSRERVLTALNHEQPDRPPIEIGGLCTSPTYGAYQNLKKYFGIEQGKAVIGGFKVMIDLDEEILERCHTDIISHYFAPQGEEWNLKWLDDKHFIDRWGVTYRDVGDYYEMIKYPFGGEITMDDVMKYNWPDFTEKKHFVGVRDSVKKLYENTDYAVCGTMCCNLLERIQWLRGLADQLCDMLVDEELAEAMLDKSLDMILGYLENYLPEVSDYVDIMAYGDDLATQESLLMSPETYRKLIKPRQAKIFEYIKAHSHAKIFYHCCGASVYVMDDLAEIGVDIINPVQPRAKGMELGNLKKRFGKKLTFWGGIDEQYTLPFGTKEEVIKETLNAIELLGPNGGFVLGPAHNIQSDVPVENLLAMCDTCANYK